MEEIFERGSVGVLGFVVDRRLAKRQEIAIEDILVGRHCVLGHRLMRAICGQSAKDLYQRYLNHCFATITSAYRQARE
ncbi:MAG: hypothetical protein ABSC37_10350 [Xanthobacteraceae bacterium]